MLKKLALTILMMTCALCASVSAQTASSPEKQAAVKELVSYISESYKFEDYMSVLVANTQAAQDAAARTMLDERADLTAEDRKSIEEALAAGRKYSVKRFQDKLSQKINYTALINEIAFILYDKYFTLEEVRDLNAFYKTPTGQKTLKIMSPMMVESAQLTQARLMPQLEIIIKEVMEEDRRELEQKIDARKSKPQKKSTGKKS